MSEPVVISVKNISKNFKLPHQKTSSIKDIFIKPLQILRVGKTIEVQHALKDISFDVKQGDFLGVVGRNGGGKSTLLKILAGIYQPTSGRVSVKGRLVPFIELGVGFNPELTGRENVYLSGALNGFSKKEIDEMYDDIVEFAELEDFMDQQLKNYSSGMQVRLAFSVAIRSEADILVLDEVLAVGDESFQRKCADFFKQVKSRNDKTIILVTHSMESVREYCNKALLINEGVVEMCSDDVDKVADRYSRLFINETVTSNNEEKRFGSGEVTIEGVDTKVTEDKISISLNIVNHTDESYDSLFVGISIKYDGQLVTGSHMKYIDGCEKGISIEGHGKNQITLDMSNILTKHDYTVDLSIRSSDGLINFDTIRDATKIAGANPRGSAYYKVLIPVSVRGENEK